ncbi:MAG: K(+)-stimulated pyrophosphate-energized sodium pump [Thermoproteota archaeon]|nr:K(+)-stimulated pyrophosphate-energized sodium pump [Thermoproteota archaeon]
MVAAFTNIIGLYFLATLLLNDFILFIPGLLGLGACLIAILTTLYYTGLGYTPIKQMAEYSQRCPAINVMKGLSLELQSPILPIISVLAAIVLSFTLSGQSLYAVIITNIGTDLMIGFIMYSDAFGPITDNAAGISEMASISVKTGTTLGYLDAVGNTMKASTKAYAMISETVTSFVISATYFIEANISNITE